MDKDINEILGVAAAPSGRRRRVIIAAAVAVLLGMVLILRACAGGGAEKISFVTDTVSRGDLVVKVTATGSLEPTNQVDVGSELSGIVRSVAVDYNDRVKTGQVLASLDTANLEAAVAQARAALESARAEVLTAASTLEESRADLQRLEKAWEISGGRVPAEQELVAARLALKRAEAAAATARANVARSEAALAVDQTNLTKALIRSPINGIVLERSVETGQTVAASLQAPVLFTLAENLTQMELHVDVDEADVGRISEGQKATFTVDAYPDRTFPATISQVRYGAQTNAGVVTYETVLDVDNSQLLLRPGMTATADITVEEVSNAVLVPNAALRFSPAATERTRQTSGSVMQRLLPRRPRRDERQKVKTVVSNGGTQQVWQLVDGEPRPLRVTTGVTDGLLTAVSGPDVEPGMQLIVDTVRTEK